MTLTVVGGVVPLVGVPLESVGAVLGLSRLALI
jgi:hypothetical protein